MGCKIPEDPEAFNNLMIEVDRYLANSGVDIPYRPLGALGEISKRYSVALPISQPSSGSSQPSRRFWPISAQVRDWYEKRYGEKVKVDNIIGRMVILIEDDMWVLKFGTLLGSAIFFVSRTTKSDKIRTDGPAHYNVLDAIEDLPQARIAALPENELEHIYQKFILGLEAFSTLQGSADKPLIKLALADISAAVEHLTASNPQYGMSKWSSLQAAEKLLKAAITLSSGKYTHTHDLSALSAQAQKAGLTVLWKELTDNIQCRQGIRYGEEVCDRDSAIIAHHATLALVKMLMKGGAAFESNLSIQFTRKPR